jgi:hypothetical protein
MKNTEKNKRKDADKSRTYMVNSKNKKQRSSRCGGLLT